MKHSRIEEESNKAERVGGNAAPPRRELLKGGIELYVDLVESKPARSSQERTNQAVVPVARGGAAAAGRWSNSKRIPSHRCHSGGFF